MTTQTQAKPKFYQIEEDGRMSFHIDATLTKDWQICERRFYLKHLLNLRPKGTGQLSFPVTIGGWWSDVMEAFYNKLQEGILHINDSMVQEIALKAWADNNVEEAALADPKRFDKFGNLAGAVLMLQQYRDAQFDIDRRNWKIIATEAGFGLDKEIFVGESENVIVYWIGKPDLIVMEGDRLLPVDHKTVTTIDGRTIGKYKPGSQMPGYCFATETIADSLGYGRRVDRCVVNICAREKPSDNPRDGKKKPRFIRAYPNYTREEIEEWRRQRVFNCERLRECILNNTWQWNEISCHNVYMRDCEFVKADGSTPGARDLVLAADFMTVDEWVPYVKNKIEKDDD